MSVNLYFSDEQYQKLFSVEVLNLSKINLSIFKLNEKIL